MDGLLVGAASAFWLGILTSISPCPLATNIAAISFIGRRVDSPRKVFLSGLLYTVGRTLVYLVLAILLIAGILYKAQVSYVLQKYINKVLGPILILVGMLLLELLQFRFSSFAPGEKTQRRVESMGIWGAGLLGIIFALSFCPISAGYFFLSLIPLSLKCGSRVLLPSLFGIGTALPVTLFAVLMAMGTRHVGKAFDKLKKFEWWARRVTGVIFILVGIYYCLVYIYGVL